MSDERPSDVLGALPRRRPHRRSEKRRPALPAERSTGTQVIEPPEPGPAQKLDAPARGSGLAEPARATAAQKRGLPARRSALVKRATATATSAIEPTTANRPRLTARRKAEPLRQPAQPPGVPPTSRGRERKPLPLERAPAQPTGRHILGTAAQAAAELTEIGLSMSARALRNAVARLPRP